VKPLLARKALRHRMARAAATERLPSESAPAISLGGARDACGAPEKRKAIMFYDRLFVRRMVEPMVVACIASGAAGSMLLFCSSGTPSASVDAGASAADVSVPDVAQPDASDITDTGAGPCPAAPPTEGSSGCTGGGGSYPVCEYGEAHCPTAFSCKAGAWSSYWTPSCGATAMGCPGSFAAASDAGACPGSTVCTYPEGRCLCVDCTNAGDAGIDSGSSEWICEKWVVPSGCPSAQPLAGTPCNPGQEGLTCDYGWDPCSALTLGDLLECNGGYWSASLEGVGVSCDAGTAPLCQ
jgi:hypothetical protein